ncbi:AsmA family protein [bacterium]|nr:AsmA family protein [bacterium]
MRRNIFIGLAVFGLLIVGLLIAPQLIPSSVYRDQIQSAGSQALGRDVVVAGPIRLSVFPRIEARASDASIANPEGFGDAPFASMGQLRAAVKLFPLIFSQRVEISEFVLVKPEINLVERADGSNNWTFDLPGAAPAEGEPAPQMQTALGDIRIRDGAVSYRSEASGQTHALTGFNLRADLRALDRPIDIEADGAADNLPFTISGRIDNAQDMFAGVASPVTIRLSTDLIETALAGEMSWGEAPAFKFKFDGAIPSATALADAFGVEDLPGRPALGRITANGEATGTPSDIALDILSARHESPLLNADFKGKVRFAEEITVIGEAAADAPRLTDLANALAFPAPGGGALGRASASTQVSGKAGDLRFVNIDFRHEGGLIALTFKGDATLREDVAYDGKLALAAPDLKQLARAAGAELPDGPAYRSFALSGDMSGSATDLKLSGATLNFDDITATGDAALAFSGKPRLTGKLKTGPIDITPYAAASGAPATETPQPGWGSEPLDLSPLTLVDADLSLDAQALKYQKFAFGPSRLLVSLDGGKLVANLEQTSLFGGAGGARIVADASQRTPAIAIDADLKGLSLKPFLGAAADFDLLEGAGDLKVNIAGAGGSLDALMASLAGEGKFTFAEGVMKGVDIPALARTARDSLAARSIPLNAFGRNAETRFRNLKASFAMSDGVAAMSDMTFSGAGFSVSGGGALDIGKQSLSFSLFPEFTDKTAGVEGFGLPIKFAGGWSGVDVSFDFDWLIKRAEGQLRERASARIDTELRRQLGGDLSSILLGPARNAPTPAAGTPPQDASAATSPETPDATTPGTDPATAPADGQTPANAPTLEDRARQEVGRRLGDLLRGN